MAAHLPATMDNVFRGGAAPSSGGPSPVVEFRAGKLSRSGRTVTADKRKGTVQLWLEPDGGLKLKWVDRNTGCVEDDIFLFQGEVRWKRVPQCKTGRVYVLDFGPRQSFFWMQEPTEERDEEYARRINAYIEDPAAARSQEAGDSGDSSSHDQMMHILQHLNAGPPSGGGGGGDIEQMLAALGGMPPPQPVAPRAGAGSSGGGGPITADTLSGILSRMGVAAATEGTDGGATADAAPTSSAPSAPSEDKDGDGASGPTAFPR